MNLLRLLITLGSLAIVHSSIHITPSILLSTINETASQLESNRTTASLGTNETVTGQIDANGTTVLSINDISLHSITALPAFYTTDDNSDPEIIKELERRAKRVKKEVYVYPWDAPMFIGGEFDKMFKCKKEREARTRTQVDQRMSWSISGPSFFSFSRVPEISPECQSKPAISPRSPSRLNFPSAPSDKPASRPSFVISETITDERRNDQKDDQKLEEVLPQNMHKKRTKRVRRGRKTGTIMASDDSASLESQEVHGVSGVELLSRSLLR